MSSVENPPPAHGAALLEGNDKRTDRGTARARLMFEPLKASLQEYHFFNVLSKSITCKTTASQFGLSGSKQNLQILNNACSQTKKSAHCTALPKSHSSNFV